MEISITVNIKLEDIDYKVTPGSPAVMYHKDGSGSPEEPAEAEIKAVWVTFKDSRGNKVMVDVSEYVDNMEEIENFVLEEEDELRANEKDPDC